MFVIHLKPSDKQGDFYVFHDGFQYVKFTNRRSYTKALRVHEPFLQNLCDNKYTQLVKAAIDKDLNTMETHLSELRQVEHLLKFGGKYLKQVNIILMKPTDQYNTTLNLWQSELDEMTAEQVKQHMTVEREKRFNERNLQKLNRA